MGKRKGRQILLVLVGSVIFVAGWLIGQQRAITEKTTVHAVAWTAAEGATEEGLADFKRATEELITSMPGLRRAWVGKLRRPLVVGDVTRTHGLVLEFDDVKSKEAYSNHPSRVPWAEVWSRVRVPRSTNFDVIGE